MARIEQVWAGEKSWGQYSLDVLGHAGLGAVYSLPFIVLGIWWEIGTSLFWFGVIWAALTGGIVRETLQYLKSDKLHLLGPPIAYGLVQLVLLFF